MDGIECVKRFREDELQKKITLGSTFERQIIVGISANSDDVTRREALESGMDGFIPKPFEMEQLRLVCSKLGLKLSL
jgi:CheY-like chemotaxis protein